jgi:hypothetical protein
MDGALRRSRMVSFRLSPDEYARLQSVCSAQGIRSLSDLARTAMQRLIESPSDEIGDLRNQMKSLAQKLDRISRVLESRGQV